MAKTRALQKPNLDTVRAFAERGTTAAARSRIGEVPPGDVRMTANIRSDLHLKLKIRAAEQRTTIGELIEGWVSGWDTRR